MPVRTVTSKRTPKSQDVFTGDYYDDFGVDKTNKEDDEKTDEVEETDSEPEDFVWKGKKNGTYAAYCSSCRRLLKRCPECLSRFEDGEYADVCPSGEDDEDEEDSDDKDRSEKDESEDETTDEEDDDESYSRHTRRIKHYRKRPKLSDPSSDEDTDEYESED